MEDTKQTPDTSISSAEHIEALNEISKKIPLLLQAAGTAVQTLTNATTPSKDQIQDPESSPSSDSEGVKTRKAVFKQETQNFYTTLHELRSKLLVQVTALENAELIPPEAPKDLGNGITNGLGNLDVGYLNSRVRDVGVVKEGELVAEAKMILEGMVKGKENGHDGDDKMEE